MTSATKRNRTDLGLAGVFLALGAFLLATGARLPAAASGQAGPGFFPLVIGAAMVLLALLLAIQAIRSRTPTAFEIGDAATIAGVIVLTGLYLLTWGLGPFAVRTFAFTTLLVRLLGASWGTGAVVAAVLTAIVSGAFQYGLGLSLE